MVDKPFTLAEYNEKCVKPMIENMVSHQLDILYGTIQLFPPGPPPTRKQKIKRWIEDKKQRCKDIWTILSGGDIHENCDYY